MADEDEEVFDITAGFSGLGLTQQPQPQQQQRPDSKTDATDDLASAGTVRHRNPFNPFNDDVLSDNDEEPITPLGSGFASGATSPFPGTPIPKDQSTEFSNPSFAAAFETATPTNIADKEASTNSPNSRGSFGDATPVKDNNKQGQWNPFGELFKADTQYSPKSDNGSKNPEAEDVQIVVPDQSDTGSLAGTDSFPAFKPEDDQSQLLLFSREPSDNPAGVHPYYAASFNYEPQECDEVKLTKGDLLAVSDIGEDGWCIGKNLNTGQEGTFPGNFVVALAPTVHDGDEDYARKLQQEEDARASVVSQAESVSLHSDEKIARRLQEEEDRKLAAMHQQSLSQRGAAPNGGDAGAASQPVYTIRHEDISTFRLKFLGSLAIGQDRGAGVVTGAIREVIAARKRQKVDAFRTFDLQVSLRGIHLTNIGKVKSKKGTIRRTSAVVEEPAPARRVTFFPLRNVSYCAYDNQNPRLFGFISKEPQSDACACHIFKYDKSAAPIANAIGRAFKTAETVHVSNAQLLRNVS